MFENHSKSEVLATAGVVIVAVLIVRHINKNIARRITERMKAMGYSEEEVNSVTK